MLACDVDDATTRQLWRAALARAVMDALGLDLCMSGTGAERETVIYGARAFLATNTLHRNLVLDAAGFCPAWFQADAVPRLRQLWHAADRGELPKSIVTARTGGARRSWRARPAIAEAA